MRPKGANIPAALSVHFDATQHHTHVQFHEALDVSISRGALDQQAFIQRFDGDDAHCGLPSTQHLSIQGQMIVEQLHIARSNLLGIRVFPGSHHNITAAIKHWITTQHFDKAEGVSHCPVPHIMGLLALDYLGSHYGNHTLLPQNAKRLKQGPGQALWQLTHIAIEALQHVIDDAAAYRQQAIHVAAILEGKGTQDNDSTHFDDGTSDDDTSQQSQSSDDEQNDEDSSNNASPAPSASDAAQQKAPSPQNDDSTDSINIPVRPVTTHSAHNQIAMLPYHVFSTQYDVVASAQDLASHDELIRLRRTLDEQHDAAKKTVQTLALRLQRLLLSKQQIAWDYQQEDGILDSRMLGRLVANPLYNLPFKHKAAQDQHDTVVSLLLDNSGSMRGRPMTVAAICADILVRTLERCGVKTEVLGFTTQGWKGGESRKAWEAQGSPPSPGRLNDLLHVIYKSADTPWRRCKHHWGLMFKEGMLKENIDGEALLWAHQRLALRPESRKLLLVISDGAPVDDSTLGENDAHYLDAHLRAVIDEIEHRSPVELSAIGIGHDVTRFYQQATTITHVDELGSAMMKQLGALFV